MEWPRCPLCDCGTLVVGGDFAACTSCEAVVPASRIQSDAMDFAKMKISLKMDGSENVSLFTQEKRTLEWTPLLAETSSRIQQRLLHQDVWLKMRRAIRRGERFTPLCVMNYHYIDHRFVSVQITSGATELIARKHAAAHDISSVMWVTDGSFDEFKFSSGMLQPVPESGLFVVHTHFYGSPTLVMTVPYSFKTGILKFSQPEFHHLPVKSWTSQAVCWHAMNWVPGRIQPRFFAGRLFKTGLCINAVVSQDLDRASPICVIAVRPSPGAEFSISNIHASKFNEGLQEVQARLKAIDEKVASSKMTPVEVCNLSRSGNEDPRPLIHQVKEFAASVHCPR